ncbi:MAG: hypothetical protein DRZ82_07655 [Thermoprotei archaeon]|nr:MAG: hypothetical protein DRZ82_07655 [Thermoprotei archaeon]
MKAVLKDLMTKKGPCADGERMRTYIFDLDGVLVDPSERLRVTLRKLRLPLDTDVEKLRGSLRRRFWEIFLSPNMLQWDKPREIGIELFHDRRRKGRVIIVTGRPITLRRHTLKELAVFGLEIRDNEDIIFRPKGDIRPDYEYKAEVISNIDDVVEIHDDSIRVLETLRRIKPFATLYLHYDNGYVILE